MSSINPAEPSTPSVGGPPKASWLRRLGLATFFAVIVRPLLTLVMGVNVFGREHLPELTPQQPFIVVANHNSHLDALALMSLFPLTQLAYVHPVAASDYFMRNRWVGWAVSTFINILPIPRSGLSKSNHPIEQMSEYLAAGHSLIIFPEGSRGEPEVMSELKRGVAHLIKRHPTIPVIPVFLKGMGRALPRGEVVLVPFFCDLLIGPRLVLADPSNKSAVMDQLKATFEILQQTIEQTWFEEFEGFEGSEGFEETEASSSA